MVRKIIQSLLLLGFAALAVIFIYNLPPVHDRLAWRIENLRADILYALNPPQEAVFVPQEVTVLPSVTPTATVTPAPRRAPRGARPGPPPTPPPSPTASPSPTPIPERVILSGAIHEYQKWNNCGPATLATALSFWDWRGDGIGDLQSDTAPFLKPNPRDKNVMPYEMVDFVNSQTSLRAVWRMGGDLELLKRLIAAGFPVVIEKGFEVPKEGWMGHYEVLTGYDDGKGRFIAQDSYIQADFPVPYEKLLGEWQAFNYVFVVIYPPEREAEAAAVLGPWWDEAESYRLAAQKASEEVFASNGRAQAFAWFNRGTSLVRLQDYAGAAQAYDEYFKLYATLGEDERPWRMLWYQTSPYFAYFYSQRYYDVLNLATTTLEYINEPAIEESYYWRGKARAALGDSSGAVADFRESLKWHEAFAPSLFELETLGAAP
jgi:hypothetical protein